MLNIVGQFPIIEQYLNVELSNFSSGFRAWDIFTEIIPLRLCGDSSRTSSAGASSWFLKNSWTTRLRHPKTPSGKPTLPPNPKKMASWKTHLESDKIPYISIVPGFPFPWMTQECVPRFHMQTFRYHPGLSGGLNVSTAHLPPIFRRFMAPTKPSSGEGN